MANDTHKDKSDYLPSVGETIFTLGDGNRDDVWDDTELIAHWDSAMDEYKRQFGETKGSPPPFGNVKTKQLKQPKQSKQLYKSSIAKNTEGVSMKPKQKTSRGRPRPAQTPASVAASLPVPPTRTEQRLFSAEEQQEDLSNLMMSWYYAGYYTGLYQAQMHKK
ncbi:hypothetical protein BDF14DRAFT_1808737 [Spinellus fusiger]|nr:hypothetical protein BDF14DRAFT_1808737 [Spinellus fusiger]